MGLKGFSLSGTGAAETRSIPEWSTQHFEATGQPLRIAIDQANWWQRNISAQKEADVKTKSPGSHPREKRIMERIFYLLRMNIQLIFIFDGPAKPAKHHQPTECTYSPSNIRLLKELLDQLGVPRHDAPGESAAECVRLHELGIVDAIWTDNTDTFMFGGTPGPTLVQFSPKKPQGDQFRNSNNVVVYGADCIRERTGLTREWFLMYATLVGCDYSLDAGLSLDPTKFFRVAQHGCFQGAANLLAAAVETPLVLSKWRIILTNIIKDTFPDDDDNEALAPPPKTFPDLTVLKSCAHPTVSPDPTLRDLPCLRDGWFKPFGPDMLSRYRFLLTNFNTRIHESWIARDLVPIELNARLRAGNEQLSSHHHHYNIQTKAKLKDRPDTTIVIDPLRVIPELLSAFPKEMYRVVDNRRVKIEPPQFRPEEMELLDCVLRRGLQLSDSEVKKHLQRYAAKPRDPRRIRPPSTPPKNDRCKNMPAAVSNSRSNSGSRLLAKRRSMVLGDSSSSADEKSPEEGGDRSNAVLPPKLAPINTRLSPPPLHHNMDTPSPTSITFSDSLTIPDDASHLLLPRHYVDRSPSPTSSTFHDTDSLMLPGELDWYPPIETFPLSRRASVLAGQLSGQYRKPSMGIGPALPMLKQPTWDFSAIVNLTDFDFDR